MCLHAPHSTVADTCQGIATDTGRKPLACYTHAWLDPKAHIWEPDGQVKRGGLILAHSLMG